MDVRAWTVPKVNFRTMQAVLHAGIAILASTTPALAWDPAAQSVPRGPSHLPTDRLPACSVQQGNTLAWMDIRNAMTAQLDGLRRGAVRGIAQSESEDL